jgi:dTDP-4-amino-4,6-dideoxygalactose transaminase
MQKAYANYGYKFGDFPVTERIAAEIVSLPMFPELTEKQQRRVVENVKEFASKDAGKRDAVREPQTSSV